MAAKLSGARIKKLRAKAYARSRGVCWYCGRSLTYEDATLEHLTPLAKGGTNDDSNLVVAHKSCNTSANMLNTLAEKLERRDALRKCRLCNATLDLKDEKYICHNCLKSGELNKYFEQQTNLLISNLPEGWVHIGTSMYPKKCFIQLASPYQNLDVCLSLHSPGRGWNRRGDKFAVYFFGNTIEDALKYLSLKNTRNARKSPPQSSQNANKMPRRYNYVNWDDYQHLLGVATDREIATAVGCHIETVRRRRRKHTIPARTNAKHDDLFATFKASDWDRPDIEIAEQVGCSHPTVAKKRKKFGIAPYITRQSIHWDRYDCYLGTMPDPTLAKLIGCEKTAVLMRRKKLGIPAHKTKYHPDN